jgi:ferredoxin--NADP+ reductase
MPSTPALATTNSRPLSATLIAQQRITPAGSPEDVRHLRFATDDAGFDARIGQCVRVLAPGQFGQRHHERLYSVADLDRSDPQRTEFALLVRRCSYVDDFNGERYAGVASNHLCDLPTGGRIEFTGPVGHPFDIPPDPGAGLLMIGMGTGIAPFRGLVRRIYETLGGWQGKVRLFYGARSGLEMLYMNEQNNDLAMYGDETTFKAFQAVSPRPHFGAPPALQQAIADHAAEVWEMLQEPRTQLYIAGPQALLAEVESALSAVAGSAARWAALRQQLVETGRWHEVLY